MSIHLREDEGVPTELATLSLKLVDSIGSINAC